MQSPIIEQGIKQGLIKLSEDGKQIIYFNQNRNRNFTNPEEHVQAETYLKLILEKGYKPERIRQFEPVKMGSENRVADIVVYHDDECKQPHILVECKKQEVSEPEFLQAIEQAYSYAYALPNNVKYVWVTSGLKDEFFEVDKTKNTRIQQPDIPRFGVKKLANYKYAFEAESLAVKEGQQNYFTLAAIGQDELTRRFKQAHDALWAGGQLNPSEAFDELDKLIFCKIWDERKDRKAGEPYDFQIITIDPEEEPNQIKRRQLENERLTERIKALYEEGRKRDPEVFRDNIRLSPEKIRTVVGYLEKVNLSDTDLDSKGRAFETFMDSFFRGSFGQYFTPRPIVKFITEVLPIQNDSLVLDTSCGSGGFLLYCLDKVRRQADSQYPKYKTDIEHNKRHYRYWHDFAEKNLFGIEINEQISRAAKMNMIIHDDGHTNVITSDGLVDEKTIEEHTKNQGFKYNRFDFIVTNPPFGSTIRQSEQAYLKNYIFGRKKEDWLTLNPDAKKLRDNQSTEILFIEQAHRFLKEGKGILAIVIPDGILTNSSLQYVRDQIEEWFRIVAVISMPQTAFAANGAGVKSSVLMLKKMTSNETQNIETIINGIEIELLNQFQYKEKMNIWAKEKNDKLKNLNGFDNNKGLEKLADIKKTDDYKNWNSDISSYYTDKINDLKEEMTEAYQKEKQKRLPDYPIFMAIAEDIGYDATGKLTGNNELDLVAEELTKFIATL